MKFIGTSSTFSDVKYYEGKIINDKRGRFQKPFFGELIEEKFNNFYEVIVSNSKKNVIRGLHFQNPPNDVDKIIFCLEGAIKDVFVDLRKSSKTFGHHVALELSSKNQHQVFIPRGFAHGFLVLSDSATFVYKVDNFYSPESERGIVFNDASLAINWKLPIESIHVSNKDKVYPTLNNAREFFT